MAPSYFTLSLHLKLCIFKSFPSVLGMKPSKIDSEDLDITSNIARKINL